MFVFSFLKLISYIIRNYTKSSATALPGLILEKYFSHIIPKLTSQLETVVVVTGTNGKTTTTRLITYLLKQNNYDFITNTSGSNLLRGILSSLIDASDIFGKLKSKIAIFEVEEGSFKNVVKYIKPNLVVVTNIFRDQLDAYGEIDKTFEYIKIGVINSNNPILVLNGDDNRVKLLKYFTKNKVFNIKLPKDLKSLVKFEKFDSKNVVNIKKKKTKYNSFYIKNFVIKQEISQKIVCNFDLVGKNIKFNNIELPLLGLFSAVNASFAIIVLNVLFRLTNNFNFSSFKPAFGRGEDIQVELDNLTTNFKILLSKNPAGLNLNLITLSFLDNIDAILFILNDNIADGRDVSWIWDADFSLLKKVKFKKYFLCGIRCWDLGVRFKYENLEISIQNIFENLEECIDLLIHDPNIKNVFVLSTYTATLEIREKLGKYVNIEKIWK